MNYRCIHCGALTDTTTHAPFCTCGGLFELDFTPPAWDAAKIDKSEWSLFRYRAFMAVDGDSWRDVTLGEGMTPTVQLEPGMYVKVDYMMPTLSFKDRGAAALVAHMKAIGVKTCVQDSSGNAGNSVAAYCARAGITCEIYVPEGTSPKKITMIEAHGAKAHVIPGTRDHCADVCRARVKETASTTPTTSPIPIFTKVRKPTSTRFSSSSAAFPTTLSFPSVTARSLSEQ